VGQHLSSAASVLMSPMEFQAAGSVGSASNSVSARISGLWILSLVIADVCFQLLK